MYSSFERAHGNNGPVRNPYLIGERLYLRPLEEADAAVCHAWLNDPEVRRTLRVRTRPHTEASSREFIRQLDPRHEQIFAAVTRGDEIYVGNCGLHDIEWVNRTAELGIVIGRRDQWGRGFGSEAVALLCQHAFETLDLRKIVLWCFASNDRGLHLYRKLGFEVEGRLRQQVYVEGQYVDEIVMALMRGHLRIQG